MTMADARVGLDDDIKWIPDPDPDLTPRVFLTAYEFIDQAEDPQPPLWGTDDVTIIPRGGLALLAGRPGAGKTTFIIDLACHLAAGLAYPPVDEKNNGHAPKAWPTPRPLRVALIENEGPREMFRSKLAEKLDRFPHNLEATGGGLYIQTFRWGSFSFADTTTYDLAAAELDEHQIDLVIGDPLATLGPAGVGSPEDTRNFVATLRPLGLGISRAFLFLHHFRERVESQQDELARISGAWGGHLDTLLTLSAVRKADQVRLAYPKLRWAKITNPPAIILGRVYNLLGFEALAEENDVTILEPNIYQHLSELRAHHGGRNGQGWQTTTEIATAIESRRVDVKKAIEGAPHLFTSVTGQGAKALGAKTTAVLWGLNEWTTTDTEPPTETADTNGDILF